VNFKVQGLLVQWLKRSRGSQDGWISLLTYWLFECFDIDLPTIVESHSLFSSTLLSPFHGAVFDAWSSFGGLGDPVIRAPTYSGGLNSRTLLSGITCKMAYLHLLEMNAVVPYCVEKIRPSFESLYWPVILYAP